MTPPWLTHAGTRVLCHRSTMQDSTTPGTPACSTPCTPVPLLTHCGPQGPAIPQDLPQRGDLHPKQEAIGLGREAANWGA